ncbi:stalk domain-containing protein [Paenibacillus sp. 3LSP]|uniref:stalk domain-containing protein n=1 Tax=Paenibacillus sp. 3LSP TaxID=2800795 RepID=UPI0028FD6553|nr:stalk domain-containing protein [Paenibacillus sp. 3LSP]MDU0329236.1 stalk domain-containing protein [Paenibacillus sp. 3LSP]
MKKYVSGFVAGLLFMLSASAFADSISLIGKKVTGEYSVVVNGEKLNDKGAVINNRTNVPVRGLSEALGADVSVDNQTKTIYVTSIITQNTTTETSTIQQGGSVKVPEDQNTPVLNKEKEIKRLKYEISMLQDEITSLKLSIGTMKENPWNYEESKVQSEIENKEKAITENESKIKELESQLAELQK